MRQQAPRSGESSLRAAQGPKFNISLSMVNIFYCISSLVTIKVASTVTIGYQLDVM